MTIYEQLCRDIEAHPGTWLVTGVAGFIGSNLLEQLLKLNQNVVGLDNFSTGKQANLDEVQSLVTPEQWTRFSLIHGSTFDAATCEQACRGVDVVLHQAALGSVPRSLTDPLASHHSNVTGVLTLLEAVRTAGIRRFVYASSCSVYGDDPQLPKVENRVGNPLSPYAATKLMNELYAGVFGRTYGTETIGLRYFNVFGKRQDPDGAYAAVIPKWTSSLLRREPVFINGDGQTSRDFCYVDNVVQANLLAATTTNADAFNQAYNISVGERTTLNELFASLNDLLRRHDPSLPETRPQYRDFRAGDVRHSLADISKAARLLRYTPTHRFADGLALAVDWYCRQQLA